MIISQEQIEVRSSQDLYGVMKAIYSARPEEERHKEHFYIIAMNSRNIIQFIDLVAIGTVNQATPYIRECLRLALIKNAVSIVAVHNHPSGDTCPSRDDRHFTQKLKEASKLLEIAFLDHLIVTEKSYYSFMDEGDM